MAKRKDPVKVREQKRAQWIERTLRFSGLDGPMVEALLSTQRQQSIRLNLLRTQAHTPPESGMELVTWSKGDGYMLSPETLDVLKASDAIRDGTIYIQNAASWLPVYALDPQPDERILDVCAAPGGKASHIQSLAGNQADLTCNDNSKPRLMKLQDTMTRMGAKAQYTLCDATRLTTRFESAAFDKLLLDAPCSGEGLMTLASASLFDSWSVAHIRRLSDLQKKIIMQSWCLLKPGGTLVYATCTMAPEENEAVIDYLLRKQADATLVPLSFALPNRIPALTSWNEKPFISDLSACLRLLPSVQTEAFFVAKLQKSMTVIEEL